MAESHDRQTDQYLSQIANDFAKLNQNPAKSVIVREFISNFSQWDLSPQAYFIS